MALPSPDIRDFQVLLEDTDTTDEIPMSSMIQKYPEEIKSFADDYVCDEDVAVLVPSLAALLRLKVQSLVHIPHVLDDVLGDSTLSVPSAVLLEPGVRVQGASGTTSLRASRSAVVFGSVFHAAIAWAAAQGQYYSSAAVSVERFFEAFGLQPFWDFGKKTLYNYRSQTNKS